MNINKKHLLLLFDRPQEPCFIEKGPDHVAFVTPPEFLNERFASVGPQIVSRFGKDARQLVNVMRPAKLPDLQEILTVKRDENFSFFIPKHRRIAGQLIDIFLGAKNVEELLATAIYVRDRINPYLFNYSFSVALLHRSDTQDLDIPAVVRYFPDRYVDSAIFSRAREEATIVPEDSRTPIEIPKDYSASDLEEEHSVAYFREDIGINLHHWHWHLVYPFDGDRRVVDKNRRGELFYYMHQQIIARYNFERFSNKLGRVERFIDWDGPISEGYFSKLDSLVASRPWPARVANQRLRNLRRSADQIMLDLDDIKLWRNRIIDAIDAGLVRDENNREIPLTENEGIDVLGNVIEASILSPNRAFYGEMHTSGHVISSYIHDPDGRHLEFFSVMGDPSTTMRDPFFYRWHSYVDDMFQKFKSSLPRYEVNRLNYPGVTITGAELQSEGEGRNVFHTFWQQSDVDLSRGMDFQPRGAVLVRFSHLQHAPFTYRITVNNEGKRRSGTCRIFLAPKFDERGNPWLFREQKNMFIELDKFRVMLKPGTNTIKRASKQSSVTIPFERTFRDVDTKRPTGGEALAQFNFCGCGWPHHMLIPKGTVDGMPCELFVMISNYDDDRVVDENGRGICDDAESYCGIKDKLYPDRRSMGYPFDRQPRSGVNTLQQFLTPNMAVVDVTIQYRNRTVKPKARN